MTPGPTDPAGLVDRWVALGIDHLEHPLLLVVLVPIALLPLALALRRRPAVPWPAMAEAAGAGARRREIGPFAGAGLRSLALLCLAGVLAGPRAVREVPPEPGLGLDLLLVVDASRSMASIDGWAEAGGSAARTRLDVAREAVARFAERRVFAGDRVGLVVFGDRAFTQCPLTSDGALVADALRRVEVGVAGDATALGDALALAVRRASATAGDAADARTVVLLTDGRSNAGDVPIGIATALAVGESVRVHTVAIGADGGDVAVETPAGLRFEHHDPDPATLRRIAERTGGRFFAVRHPADLLAVYAAIDALERSQRPLPRRRREAPRPEPLLATAGGAILLELLGLRAWRRTLP